MPATTTIDGYMAALPEHARQVVNRIRGVIAAVVPTVQESIRYQMPVFRVDDTYLVYVGAWKHHVGLYPIPTLPDDLEPDIAPYRTKTDTVRFLYSEPIPYDVIERLIEALVPIRLADNQEDHQ